MWFTKVSDSVRDAQISIAAFLAAIALVLAAIISGFADNSERQLRDLRDTLRVSAVSGDIVIAEIDGRSLQELDKWPWPRGYFADAVQELDRLGAAQIAFDVEFSAQSDRNEDEKFAKALRELSQPTILPTFRQENLAGEKVVISEALPLEILRENAFLASVNVRAAADGQIKHYSYGETTFGVPRPSLANMLARTGGAVDESFRIDQAIDPLTIPRISFVDLIEGKVPRAAVAGKSIVFGNAAIELGDRYPTALFGVRPGVDIHVQAAETLKKGTIRGDMSPIPIVIGLALLVGGLAWSRARDPKPAFWKRATVSSVFASAVIVAIALIGDQLAWAYMPLFAPLLFVATFVIAKRTLGLVLNLQLARLTDSESGLPNRARMRQVVAKLDSPVIAAARIADYSDLLAMLTSDQQTQLDLAIARRLALLDGVEEVFRIESGIFGWVMGGYDQNETAEDVAEEIFSTAKTLFNAPVDVDGERVRVSMHYGMAQGDIAHAVDASELARRKGFVWSGNAAALHEETQYRQRLLGELDEALLDGSISVVFQPKLGFASGQVSGGECLVRWKSAQLGHVSPADFIPLLEEKGRVHDLTLFVMREAIRRQKEAADAGYPLTLAVNVSAQLLDNFVFIEMAVQDLIAAGCREKGGITLEITESAPLQDSETAKRALTQLREAGARISIDDYGTGQATLNYLQDFPAQEIKLDQSFIRDLVDDRKDQIMVQSTIDLAHALGFEIVAEGVETQEILDILAGLGCDYAQGWHVGKPMAWEDFFSQLGTVPVSVSAGKSAAA
ncbi:MAG: EAL domain-containing protein [Pseudomonadota bacterium]|nr:EAL domain-containing protein [Pseudomonadota bacterium]